MIKMISYNFINYAILVKIFFPIHAINLIRELIRLLNPIEFDIQIMKN